MTIKLGPVFELLRGPGLRPPIGARGAAVSIFGPFFPNMPNHLTILKTKILGALLAASGLLNL